VYALDSSNHIATNQLILIHNSRREYDSAMRYARREVELEPNAMNLTRVAGIHLTLRQTEAAQALLDSLIQASPASVAIPAVQFTLLDIQTASGRRDSAATLLQRSQFPSVPAQIAGMQRLAGLAATAGRIKQALGYNRRFRELLAGRGVPVFDGQAEAVWQILYLGQPEEGVRRIEAILASRQWADAEPSDRPYLWASRMLARAGRPERARAVVARFRAEDPAAGEPLSRAELAQANAEIALAEGKPAEAVALFRAADLGEDGAPSGCEACTYADLARAFDRAGQSDSTVAYLERYLERSPPRRQDAQSLAFVQKRLGELYDGRNERQRAIRHYEAFVEQWKDADPELQPAVATVRARLTELRAREGR